MMLTIQRADEIADFAVCLGDIDDIFFESSVRRDFCGQEEKQAFREMSLGRYVEKHRSSFFVTLDDDGRAVGYLAGCLENPLTLKHSNDVSYFRYIEDIWPRLHCASSRQCSRAVSKSRLGNCTYWTICRLGQAAFGRGNPNRDIEYLSEHSILPKVRLC
jgi:hypothetical protein